MRDMLRPYRRQPSPVPEHARYVKAIQAPLYRVAPLLKPLAFGAAVGDAMVRS